MRRFLLPSLLALAIALPVASPSLSALRTGTNGPETLIGTDGNDQLNGMGDADHLKGKAGNDTYYFGDNFSAPGADKVIEKPGEGTDTITFRGVTTGAVTVYLVREWASIDGYRALGPGGEVELTYKDVGGRVKSFIETVVGGRGNPDVITAGGGAHTLQPGGGGQDNLIDYGGRDDGPAGRPDIPASNDVYKGFADNTGTDYVTDYGGEADVLAMRPFATDEVYIAPLDLDAAGGAESLQIVTSAAAQVIVVGHFSPQTDPSQDGRMERIVFADETITETSTLAAASAESLNPRQARLAKAAPRLAREARALAARHDPTGTKAKRANGDGTADGGRGTESPGAQPDNAKAAKTAKNAKTNKGAKPRDERQGKRRQHRRR